MENEHEELEAVPDDLWLTPQGRAEAAKASAARRLPPPAIQTTRSDDEIAIET
jgi:hypothetical protein